MKHLFLTRLSADHPRWTIAVILAVTLLLGSQLRKIQIDTDPENMLDPGTPARAELNRIEERFGIKDIMVLGLERRKGDLFTQQGLNAVFEITNRIRELPGIDLGEKFQSLNTIDHVALDDEGTMVVRAFLFRPLDSDGAAAAILDQVNSNRILKDKLASSDGRSVAIYIPINSKDDAASLHDRILGAGNDPGIVESVAPGMFTAHLAGVPVAQSVFGRDMFRQMAVLAPLAGLVIFVGLWLMFKKINLILAPMGVALMGVVWTMGLLVGTGHPVHIMSSMAPVFLMVIGVGDGIHLLSQYYDTRPQYASRREAVMGMMDELFKPVMFTSITTALGFASLATVDIPPVRVFGIFVAFGVMAEWLLTMTLIPALMMLGRDMAVGEVVAFEEHEEKSRINRWLHRMGEVVMNRPGRVLLASALIVAAGAAGLLRLEVNDNPVKWFKASSPIREANAVLNEQFGGTYLAYIEADAGARDAIKKPENLQYIQRLQEALEASPLVGKTTSLADVVRRVNRVIVDDQPESENLPNDAGMVAELLFAYQSSGAGPDSLDNLTTPDFSAANIWLQMKSGDNKDMAEIESLFNRYVAGHAPPPGLQLTLSGPNHLNMVWQQIMVHGMFQSLIGSMLVVWIMLMIQFRSFYWGSIGMLPLSLTILLSYGMLGWMGRSYDMPVAVLSALTLGMAVDFAIHFIQRYRDHLAEGHGWREAVRFVLGEPSRAILRNAVILLTGFSVMFLANLVPYITVGFFMSAIMLLSSFVTIVLIPALIALAPQLGRPRVSHSNPLPSAPAA